MSERRSKLANFTDFGGVSLTLGEVTVEKLKNLGSEKRQICVKMYLRNNFATPGRQMRWACQFDWLFLHSYKSYWRFVTNLSNFGLCRWQMKMIDQVCWCCRTAWCSNNLYLILSIRTKWCLWWLHFDCDSLALVVAPVACHTAIENGLKREFFNILVKAGVKLEQYRSNFYRKFVILASSHASLGFWSFCCKNSQIGDKFHPNFKCKNSPDWQKSAQKRLASNCL